MAINGKFAASTTLLVSLFLLALLGGNNWVRPIGIPHHTNLTLIVAPSYERGECNELRVEVSETYSQTERTYFTYTTLRKENRCRLINGEPELVYLVGSNIQSHSSQIWKEGGEVRVQGLLKPYGAQEHYSVEYKATITTNWKWQQCFGVEGPEYCLFRMGEDQESPQAQYTLEVQDVDGTSTFTDEERYSVFVMKKSR